MRAERGSFVRELGTGARALVDGMAFVLRTEGAMKAALLPAAIAFGVGVVLFAVGVWGVVTMSARVVGSVGELAAIGRVAFDVVFGGLALFTAVVVALAVAQPLSRVALDRLAARMSLSLGMPEAPRASSRFFASMGTALAALGVTLPTIGIIEAFTAIAPEAAIVTEPLAFVASALALAWDLFDHPMSRQGLDTRARLAWMKKNAALVVGFGLAAQTLLLLPVLDLFLLPVGILGATKLLAIRGVEPPALPSAPAAPPPHAH